KNFTREDSVVIRYYSSSNIFKGHKGKKYSIGIPMQAVLQRCIYADLDEIYDFVCKYHEKMGLPTDDVKDIVMDNFQQGAIYKITKANNIVAIIPIGIGVIKYGSKKGYCFLIRGLPCLYYKDENRDLAIKCVNHILQEIAQLHPQNAIMCVFSVVAKDDFANAVARHFSKSWQERGPFSYYSILSIYETDEERKERLKNNPEKPHSFFAKIEEEYSDFIRSTFRIRSVERFGKSEQKPVKKREKRRREYDEYDLEYYNLG
ncbi:MAG: hypothetical protein K6G10_06690, partial [Butyrivibrio sp.]|nr:hypothetical protein [Butyrivibrio sp.]